VWEDGVDEKRRKMGKKGVYMLLGQEMIVPCGGEWYEGIKRATG